jgi:hypothetical protein
MWKTAAGIKPEATDAADVEIDIVSTSSVIPAIDQLVARYTGRGSVAAAEIIDALLDLRLLAEADDLLSHELPAHS